MRSVYCFPVTFLIIGSEDLISPIRAEHIPNHRPVETKGKYRAEHRRAEVERLLAYVEKFRLGAVRNCRVQTTRLDTEMAKPTNLHILLAVSDIPISCSGLGVVAS